MAAMASAALETPSGFSRKAEL
jgi:hypothetical protein